MPLPGRYVERIKTDDAKYGGSGIGNPGGVYTEEIPWHGRTHSLDLPFRPVDADPGAEGGVRERKSRAARPDCRAGLTAAAHPW
ncbi:alpha amylase C-terminal domain-containing protein [Azospirillum endophyticum]